MTEAKRPRGRPRNDGLPAGSPEAKAADTHRRVQGAVNGPNAPTSKQAGDPPLPVLFSLLQKREEIELADLAFEFLESLKIPEGKKSWRSLEAGRVSEAFRSGRSG